MENLFDIANYPTSEPNVMVSGDRIAWKRIDIADIYPISAYTLKYSALIEGKINSKIDITAIAGNDTYIVIIDSVVTAAWPPGIYHWQSYIERIADNQRITLESGRFEVLENGSASNSDPRGHVKKVLDSIEAVIEKRATKDQEAYMISNRSLSRTPIADLIMLRAQYRREYQILEQKERLKKGAANPYNLHARLN